MYQKRVNRVSRKTMSKFVEGEWSVFLKIKWQLAKKGG